MEDVAEFDVVLVCCGGGGLVAGVAAAIKLSGRDQCRVFAVEPEGCESITTMHAHYVAHFLVPDRVLLQLARCTKVLKQAKPFPWTFHL